MNSSKNSQIAKSGFQAEEIFRSDVIIKKKLENYFNKKIIRMNKIHGKKYDTEIYFDDETIINIQNKKIENYNGRGDSFDRRHIKHTFSNIFIRKYLTLLTLIRKSKRKTLMSIEQKKDFIKLCNNNLDDILNYINKTLIGENDDKNHYWCIMKTDLNFSTKELYIISSNTLFNFIINNLNIDIKFKDNGTSLHLSKNISLQRKGGEKTDKNPNHIQAKLKFTLELLELCDKIL